MNNFLTLFLIFLSFVCPLIVAFVFGRRAGLFLRDKVQNYDPSSASMAYSGGYLGVLALGTAVALVIYKATFTVVFNLQDTLIDLGVGSDSAWYIALSSIIGIYLVGYAVFLVQRNRKQK